MSQYSALPDSFDLIQAFKGLGLTARIKQLEDIASKETKAGLRESLALHSVSRDLLCAALDVKRAAAQIDTLIHSIGILICQEELLDDDERVLSLPLGAGNTGKPFDLLTVRIPVNLNSDSGRKANGIPVRR